MMNNDIVTTRIINDLRIYNQYNGNCYFILCKAEIFKEVFDFVKTQTDCIIVIKTVSLDLSNLYLYKNNKKVKNFYINNCGDFDLAREGQISKIQHNEGDYKRGLFVDYGGEKCNYISTPMKMLLRSLASTKLAIAGFVQDNMKFFPLFSDSSTSKMKVPKKKVLITVWGGYGDGIILLRYIQKFIDRKISEGNLVHIVAGDSRIYTIFSNMLRNCKVFLIDMFCKNKERNNDFLGKTLLNQLLADLGYYKEFYNLNVDYSHFSTCYHHIIELWTCVLNIPINDSYEINLRLPNIKKSILNVINEAKKDKKRIVGIQFDSSTGELRTWPKDNVKEFIKLCKQHNMFVINLTPYPNIDKLDICDVSNMDILRLLSCISLMDIVVGIDSVCGHMAAMLGIPNISIWNRSTPVSQYKMKVSFRPLHMNYSMVHISNDISQIMPEIVFNRVVQILDNRIKLKKECITIEDTLNCVGVEYINCQ